MLSDEHGRRCYRNESIVPGRTGDNKSSVAYSPQAKGRVERNHAVYQDRFVKKLRLGGISTIKKANQYLNDEYIASINKKFAINPKNPEDGHAPLLDDSIHLYWKDKHLLFKEIQIKKKGDNVTKISA